MLYCDSMLDQLSQTHSEHGPLQHMFEQAPGFIALLEGTDHRIVVANKAFRDLVGEEDLVGRTVSEALPEFVLQGMVGILDGVDRSGQAFVGHAMPLCVARPDGTTEELLVDLVFQPLPDGHRIFVQGHNVTDDKRGEAVRTAHNKVLELAIGDSPLETTLSELISIVEDSSRTGVLGSILLLDGDHLRHGAAPSLPKDYCDAIDGAPIGPCVGSCGTAAYLGAAVFVNDIENDPLWADFRELAMSHGLRACWSTPIFTRGRKVLGTFAMYHREPREPTMRDLMLVDLVTQTAALVIDREQAQQALKDIAGMIGQSPVAQSSSSS